MSLLKPHFILMDGAAGGAADGGQGGGGDAGAQAAIAAAAAAAKGGAQGGGGDAAGQAAAAAAAAAKPAPFYDGLYDKEGKIDPKALDRLPDHLKPHKDWISKYPTIDALINGGANAHTMAVKKALAPLAGNEPPEIVAERKAHLDALNGVPKDPKGYGIARPQDLPEQFWNEELAGKFGQIALKHSASPALVKELMGLQLESTRADIARGQAMETEYYSGQDKAYETAIQKLGIDGDRAADLMKRGAQTAGIDLKDHALKSASVRLAMIRVTQLVSEEKLITGEGGEGKAGGEREEARRIMGDPTHPMHTAWSDPNNPQHQAARDRVNALYAAWKGPRT